MSYGLFNLFSDYLALGWRLRLLDIHTVLMVRVRLFVELPHKNK
jgi:hypothetical protein